MKKVKTAIFLLFFSLFLVSCSSLRPPSETGDGAASAPLVGIENDMQADREDAAGAGQLIGNRIIQTVEVTYRTIKFDETIAFIKEAAEKYDAYVEYSYEYTTSAGEFGIEGGGRVFRGIQYTLRVPTGSLDEFLKTLEEAEAAKVSEQIGKEDISQAYRDTKTRIAVLKRKENRLNELLEQAESIEQILQIENSLSDTISEREQLESQLRNYDDLMEYTAVHLTLEERPRVGDIRGEHSPFLFRLKEAALDSLYVFYYALQNIVIWLVYAFPFLLVLALVFLAVKKVKNKKKNKKK